MNRCALAALAAISACVLFAQPKGGPRTMADDLKQSYNQMKNLLTRAADEMPDTGYSFQPTPEERNFGGWVAHVADAQANSCGRVSGNAQNLGAAQMTSKADLVSALKKSFDVCDAVYEGATEANANDPVQSFGGTVPRISALYGNIAHDQECYGSMAVYLRLQKLVPPSSQGRGGFGGGKGKGPGGGGKQ
ncbi:MAG: DinB family protein [Bryobacterales bacterium]|nr:DinB family protein [Bryobacterales bacterium]MBV9401656.1 DinB family protein [Bryobacterales bacterium]